MTRFIAVITMLVAVCVAGNAFAGDIGGSPTVGSDIDVKRYPHSVVAVSKLSFAYEPVEFSNSASFYCVRGRRWKPIQTRGHRTGARTFVNRFDEQELRFTVRESRNGLRLFARRGCRIYASRDQRIVDETGFILWDSDPFERVHL